MIDLIIEDVTGKSFPVTIDGKDTGGCEIVLRAASNTKKYTTSMALTEGKTEFIRTMFLEHFVRFDNPFKINGEVITAEHILTLPCFSSVFDNCIEFIFESFKEPEKN